MAQTLTLTAIKPLEQGMAVGFTNMFLLQHSDVVPELNIKSEEEYRFYRELKRASQDVDIADDKANIGFKHGDTYFDFHDGEILMIKDNKIIHKCAISDFAKRPGSSFRMLTHAMEGNKKK